ncbi:MAG: PDZ domain-containing protein [Phycisphaerae bacterium]
MTARSPRFSGVAIGSFIAITVAVVLLTGVVGIWTWHRKDAQRELTKLIDFAEKSGRPEEVIRVLELYLASQKHPRQREIASQRLTQARKELDDYDFEQAQQAHSIERDALDETEEAYRSYLRKHPKGAHRDQAQTALDRVAARRDDYAYEDSTRIERERPSDFQKQKEAWEAYLAAYPEGRHVREVRLRIADIPDRIDEALYQEHVKEIKTLETTGRLIDALDRSDVAKAEVKSASRRAGIRDLTKRIESKLEEKDAEACLRGIKKTRKGRNKQRRACHLFILCYPDSQYRSQVERQLKRIESTERFERWRKLESKLNKINKQPTKGLRLLEEYIEDTGDQSPAVLDYITTFEWHRVVLKVAGLLRKVEDSLMGVQTVRKQDGTIILASEIIRQTEHIFVRDTEGQWEKYRRTEVNRIGWPILPGQAGDLARQLESQPDSFDADPTALQRRLESLLDTAQGEYFREQRRAIQKGSTLIREHFKADRKRRRRSKNRVVLTQQDSSAHRSRTWSPKQILQHYERIVDSKKQAQQNLKRNTPEYVYRLLARRFHVPIEFKLLKKSRTSELLSEKKELFHCKIAQEYDAQLVRLPDPKVPRSLYSDIDKELKSLSTTMKVTFEHEIRSLSRQVIGVGVVLGDKPHGSVIERIITGTAADRTGLEPGDRIAAVDGEPILPEAAGAEIEALIASGRTSGVEFLMRRSGRRFRITLAKSAYEIHRYERRIRYVITPSTAFQQNVVQSEWSDIEPPKSRPGR